jgi:two-component system sensor histidine kinase YesM
VLKFILQPIIENAIVHGFKDKTETGYIEVSAYIEKNKLFIKVEDDGNGMTEDKVEALNDYINKKDDNITKAYRKSIGIRNVNMRIKLACGDEYGIKISSDPGSGTKVLYTLPIYGLEEEI